MTDDELDLATTQQLIEALKRRCPGLLIVYVTKRGNIVRDSNFNEKESTVPYGVMLGGLADSIKRYADKELAEYEEQGEHMSDNPENW